MGIAGTAKRDHAGTAGVILSLRFPKLSVLAALLILLALPAAAGTRVIDGDTLVLDGAHIRLWDIDAPEMNHPGGVEAKRALTELLRGHHPTCKPKDTDRYGRTVAQCFLEDGTDLARWLVDHGFARDWPKYSKGYYR